jgi:hypothetical protein
MKRSPGSRNKPSKLSESIHGQLNQYALAATAAGVTLIALVQPAEGRIVYTKAHRVIELKQHCDLDLNHDGKIDFIIKDSSHNLTSGGWWSLFVSAVAGNEIAGSFGKYGFLASALERGARISKSRNFSGRAKMFFNCSGSGCYPYSPRTSGNWINVTNRYLGLKFKVRRKTHYGWVRLSVRYVPFSTLSATLTGYAYETIPNKPIIAGKTKGLDGMSVGGPDAAVTKPIPKPASLGALAMGAPGLSIWWRKESVVAAH